MRRLQARARHEQALKLRLAGYSYRDIARELGYSDHSAAYQAVTKLLTETVREPADEVRSMELDRLDGMWKAIAPSAELGDVEAIDRALKIQARRAALQGLDAPKKIAPTNPDGTAPYESLPDDAKLEKMLGFVQRALGRDGEGGA